MGFLEWIAGFTLPKTEDECNALRTDEAGPKPVQWTDDKCTFFVPTDEARLGMSNCTAGQMFDMSNNTCGAKVTDSSCGVGKYRASEEGECVDAPATTFNQESLVTMGAAMTECGGMVVEDGTGTHSWTDGACSLSCNEGYSLNDDGTVCAPSEETEEFTNRIRKLSDRDVMLLIILVILMYKYRKEIKQALSFKK